MGCHGGGGGRGRGAQGVSCSGGFLFLVSFSSFFLGPSRGVVVVVVVVLFAPQLPKYPCGAQQIESRLWFLSTMWFLVFSVIFVILVVHFTECHSPRCG